MLRFSAIRRLVINRWVSRIALSALVAPWLVIAEGRADEATLPTSRAAVDAVLVIDASGSMLMTDAQKLRYEGAKAFLKFLDDRDRLAIVSFTDTAQVLRELKDFKREEIDQIGHQIEGIKTDGKYSDLLEAVRMGAKVLEGSQRGDADRLIIILSDGKMEPNPAKGPAAGRTAELISQVLPDLKSKEVKVDALAFSDQADKALLSEIAASTDGLFWFSESPDQIHKSFADLFLAVKHPQLVPMRSQSFTLDERVDEATFYITHHEGEQVGLLSPKGEQMSPGKIPEWITWFSGRNFDVITMREPDIGEWLVQGGASAESFATVLTNLKLVTDWPLVVRQGEEAIVQARLYEGDKPVAIPEMSGVVQYSFQIIPTDRVAAPVERDLLNDDGREGDRVARDGIFSRRTTLNELGEYKLSIVVRGPTFERTQQVPFRVREKLIKIGILPSASHSGTHDHDEHVQHGHEGSGDESAKDHHSDRVQGDENGTFWVELSKEASSFRNLEIKLEVVSEAQQKTTLPLRRVTGEGPRFEASTGALPSDGLYTIRALVKAESKQHQEIEAESPSLRFERVSLKKATAAPTATPIKEVPVESKAPSNSLLLNVVVVSVVSLLVLTLGWVLTKRSAKRASPVKKYTPPSQMLEAVAELEARLTTSEIKVGDVTLEGEPPAEGEQSAEAPQTSPSEGGKVPQASATPTAETPPGET